MDKLALAKVLVSRLTYYPGTLYQCEANKNGQQSMLRVANGQQVEMLENLFRDLAAKGRIKHDYLDAYAPLAVESSELPTDEYSIVIYKDKDFEREFASSIKLPKDAASLLRQFRYASQSVNHRAPMDDEARQIMQQLISDGHVSFDLGNVGVFRTGLKVEFSKDSRALTGAEKGLVSSLSDALAARGYSIVSCGENDFTISNATFTRSEYRKGEKPKYSDSVGQFVDEYFGLLFRDGVDKRLKSLADIVHSKFPQIAKTS